MRVTRPLRLAVLALVVTGFLFLSPSAVLCESSAKSPDYRELRLFRQVMGIVQKNYVKEVSDKDLIQGAINGMLQALDPHSSFLTEELFKELQVETKGEFGGLGIEITLENGILTIVSPIEDTPAFKAGLKPGDKIIKIDGDSTKNITLIKAVKKMRGHPGTKVTITVMREGWKKFKDFTVVRDKIKVQSVKKDVVEPGFAYVRLSAFQEMTDHDLTAALRELTEGGKLKGVILDLRSNPGGLLDQAVKVTNLFLEKGLIVYTDGRAKDQHMEFWATTTGTHYDFKLAVLLNEGSASASEIVAGALQDHDRALVFGTKSFGKSSVQTIIPMENGAGLRLTTAYYYTPKKRNLNKTGIEPDVDLKEEVQKQVDEEIEEESKPPEKRKKPKYPRPVVDKEKDPVVTKALEWLKSDATVKQWKQDNPKKPIADTAHADPFTTPMDETR